MNVLIAGASGRVSRILIRLLIERGDRVAGIIRRENQRPDLEALGANAIVLDIAQDDLATSMNDIDAVVFAAAGGAHEYDNVDHRGADRLAAAAEANGVKRYILLSANGAHDPNSWGSSYAAYLRAKRAGENAVKARNLDWTVVRPAALSNDTSTGNITLLTSPGGTGSITREDVARTLLAVLNHENTIGKTLELWSGRTPIDKAIASV